MSHPSDDTLIIHHPPFLASELPKPFSSLVEVEFGAATHEGKVRPHNEDAYLVFKTGRSWERVMTSLPQGELPQRFDEAGYAMAVADGMGGHKAGDVASNMALRTAVAVILNMPQWALKLDNPLDRMKEIDRVMERARNVFRSAHRAINERALGDPGLASMGTTMTSTYSFANDLFVIHVGDSRVYQYRRGELRQLTRDHTLAQEMADAGAMSQAEAQGHRLSHVLTRAIGGGNDEAEVEVDYHELEDGDVLLLCTDGLTNMVSERGIASILERHPGCQEACDALIQKALEAGGKDNVTAVMGRYRIPSKDPGSGARGQGIQR
jgi:protein phosphatase